MTDPAQQHRPLDRDELRVAARELEARGWQARDIADAFKLTDEAVCELLSAREGRNHGGT